MRNPLELLMVFGALLVLSGIVYAFYEAGYNIPGIFLGVVGSLLLLLAITRKDPEA